MLEHGGDILSAARRYGIPPEQWLDLSTGINPNGWSVPVVDAACWRRLPLIGEALLTAAGAYYGCASLLAVAGSQAAIQALPALRPASRVGVLHPAYGEHAQAWRQAGHSVQPLSVDDVDAAVQGLDVLVVVNPNNPTGRRFPAETLLRWHDGLRRRGGWLVVDEAFMDATPQASIAGHAHLPGLIVLRSLGKFFGLAGARVGFALAEQGLLQAMSERLGPWTVSGPALAVTQGALADKDWQEQTRSALAADSLRLRHLMTDAGLAPQGGTALFQWTCCDHATEIHHVLAGQGILVRCFEQPRSLRIGLPANAAEWQRLEHALQQLSEMRT